MPCGACHQQSTALRAKIPKALLVDLKKRKRDELFSRALFDWTKPLTRCESCHADVHQSQFKDNTCSNCHQVASFHQVRFDHQKDSRFPLEGAHQDVKCEKCHFASGPKRVVVYKPLARTCQSCHLDVHAGQFAKGSKPTKCEHCHQVENWEKTLFTHAPPFTDFELDGQHRLAKCESCHRKVEVANRVAVVQYRPLPRTCEGCHTDFHRGGFQGFEP